MRKYHGTLIHRSRDADGPIEVVDDGVIRTLHFGNDVRQSSMALHDPVHLMLLYTQAMMSCLLFQPDPKRVLLIGLGGGSLAKFLLHHFPRCKIDAVERRAAVVKLAHGYFQLPETPRLRVTVDDACEHLKLSARSAAAIRRGGRGCCMGNPEWIAITVSPPAAPSAIIVRSFGNQQGSTAQSCGYFCRLRLAVGRAAVNRITTGPQLPLYSFRQD